MRTGPHPLTAHLSLAAQSHALSAGAGTDNAQLHDMLEGVKKYQAYGDLPVPEPLPVAAEKGSMRLLAAKGAENPAQKPPVLLVPSLINRYHVFDLHPSRSFVRWLAAQGLDVYVIDWGDLREDDGQGTLDDVIAHRLNFCAEFLSREHGQKVQAIGYCMGGTLLAGAAHLRPDLYHALVFLAAPWDFSCAGDEMVRQMKIWAPSAYGQLTSTSYLPCAHIQTLFASLYPEQALHKFSGFLHMEEGSEQEQLFVAVEDWLNDGVDLPREIALTCIRDWYGENATGEGAWQLCGQAVVPEEIECPAFVVASGKDKLVDARSSRALYDALPRAELYDPGCGHIGMMAGRRTIESVWEPIRAWIVQQNPL